MIETISSIGQKLIISSLLSLVFSISNCQETIWFQQDTEWHYTYIEGSSTPNRGYVKLEMIKDTTINSKTYHVLDETTFLSNGDIRITGKHYLRYADTPKRVFQYRNNSEQLLYDFSALEGDTITIPVSDPSETFDSIHLVVDSISVKMFSESIQRKVQYCRVVEAGYWFFGGTIIEGIGSEFFLFPVDELACDAGCAHEIRCYHDLNINYQVSEYLDCDELITGGEFYENDIGNIQIYPNPAVSFIEIESKQEIVRVVFYNTSGAIVRIDEPMSNQFRIDVGDLYSGLYLLKMEPLCEKLSVHKLLIK